MIPVIFETIYSRQILRREWHRFLYETSFTRFVTFNFNPHEPLSIAQGHKMLAKFGTRINRQLHGQNYHRKPNHDRTWFIAVPEHPDSNLHFHAALFTPNADNFDAVAVGIWEDDLVPSGQLDFQQKLFDENDRKKIAGYCTKCCAKDDSFEDIFIFSDVGKRG